MTTNTAFVQYAYHPLIVHHWVHALPRYELASAASGTHIYFGGGNTGERGTDVMGGRLIDVFDTATFTWKRAEMQVRVLRINGAQQRLN